MCHGLCVTLCHSVEMTHLIQIIKIRSKYVANHSPTMIAVESEGLAMMRSIGQNPHQTMIFSECILCFWVSFGLNDNDQRNSKDISFAKSFLSAFEFNCLTVSIIL